MFQGKEVWLFIPAKKDNAGCPGKNRAIINGKRIIEYTLKAAHKCPYIDHTFLITNDPEVSGVPNVALLPEYFLLSQTTICIREAVRHLVANGLNEPNYIIEAFASTPVRPPEFFSTLMEGFANPRADSVFSVEIPKIQPHRFVTFDEHNLTNWRQEDRGRQEYPLTYAISSAGWACKWSVLKEAVDSKNQDPNTYYGQKAIVPIEGMVIDIDSMDDLRLAAAWLSSGDR